ncbi:hypothetical protein EDEG_02889 [Edhazardia aedis USNM 41457]|uniref:Uncharacterized protein n=1 Tax=Edhazardia aedis (strain USNM 41457) TaxID=1003232 RepID=J9DJB9_EDHAE|nr:hypothetical protein EDEG_02889 [Edhazardia aedis USNM 41457]|eukprot:EJW02705.1 hypothetical protein EDEG_02889 [Edhazardia aedis USNM 41457]
MNQVAIIDIYDARQVFSTNPTQRANTRCREGASKFFNNICLTIYKLFCVFTPFYYVFQVIVARLYVELSWEKIYCLICFMLDAFLIYKSKYMKMFMNLISLEDIYDFYCKNIVGLAIRFVILCSAYLILHHKFIYQNFFDRSHDVFDY